jgi:hypothetical protein
MRPFLAKGMIALSSAVFTGFGGTAAMRWYPAAPTQAPAASRARAPDPSYEPHNFYFTRGVYTGTGRFGFGGGRGGGGGNSWATDYPKADQQLMTVVRRLINIDAFPYEHPVRLDDPELRRFPFLYCVEVGHMNMTDTEIKGLRSYIDAGGFLFVDDFWGSREWAQFEDQMHKVFPEYSIVEIPKEHEVFHSVYNINQIVQVPNVGNGTNGGPTYEQDGYVPHIRGIFDDTGRLLVLIDWNSDMGDAWEWAEQPAYSLKYSTYAFQMTVNAIVYSMSH